MTQPLDQYPDSLSFQMDYADSEEVQYHRSYIHETTKSGVRVPVGSDLLHKYRIRPGKQERLAPVSIAVAALLEVQCSYLIRIMPSYTSSAFHGAKEAHFEPLEDEHLIKHLTLEEIAILERAVKMQYEAFKYPFTCEQCQINFNAIRKLFEQATNRKRSAYLEVMREARYRLPFNPDGMT